MPLSAEPAAGFVPVPGGTLYHEAEGAGPAVCLVHAGVANLRMWDGVVRALASKHRVVRYDTRGYGRSRSERVEFSDVEDLIAVLDHAGADRAVLVGASRGADIVLGAALDHPTRVAGLVSVAGSPRGIELPPTGQDETVWEEEEARLEAKDWEWVADLETAWWVDGPGQVPERVDAALRTTVRGWILENYRAEKEPGIPVPIEPGLRLGELTMPLAVMVGDLDDADVVAASRILAERVEGASFEVFAGAAHMLGLEQPERFLGSLRRFLSAVSW